MSSPKLVTMDESNHSIDDEELQQALGVNASGMCARHPNCPVLSLVHNKVMSCRVCFSEEKSVGIRQRKSFAAVVHQLQRMSEEKETANEDEEERRRVKRAHSANMQALLLQQPQTMDSVMKRLAQVQNWVLRQKEKEVLSLQLQIQRLEEKLYEAESQNQEQKQTIWALRRTIQQDLKLIKTMAVQKGREMEGSVVASPNSTDGSVFTSPRGRAPFSAASSAESTPSASPMNAHASANVANMTNMNRVRTQLEKVRRAPSSTHSGISTGMVPAYFKGTDEDEDESEQNGDVFDAHDRRSPYWNNSLAGVASDPVKLFASFRGGLLDIPKSPPAPHHDKGRGKLTLDPDQLAQLKMPRMRGVHRAISDDGSVASGISNPGMTGIPLGMLAANVRSLPFTSSWADPSASPEAQTRGKPTSSPSKEKAPNAQASTSTSNSMSKSMTTTKTNARQPMRSTSRDKIEPNLGDSVGGETSPGVLYDDGSKSMLSSTYSIASLTSTKHLIKPENSVDNVEMGHTDAETDDKDDEEASDEQEEEDQTNRTEDDKTVDTTPSFFNDRSVVGDIDGPIAEEEEEALKKETNDDDPAKFLFPVTGASCQDKYGDTGLYTGTILVTEGMPHGKGTMNYESGRVYSGMWVSGQWHGRGKLLNANGDTYEGEFVYDARHGKGVYKWDNGDVYTGDFSLDKREGKGRFCFHNGNIYEGEFVDGMFEGFGKYTFEDGYYEGEWKDGRYHGDGELRYATGGKYVGEFRESLANGFGMEVMKDGTKRRGVWEKGQPVEMFEKP